MFTEDDSEDGVRNTIFLSPYGLQTRTSLKVLYDTMKVLSDDQKQSVRDMGMGTLLDMIVDGVPGKLGYYVVDNLDTINIRINMVTGYLRITEKSIHDILGIPLGEIDIMSLQQTNAGKDLTNAWKRQFDKDRISPNDVLDVIKKMKNQVHCSKSNSLGL